MPSREISQLSLFVSVLATAALAMGQAQACPFCSAVSQTFSEEIESMDVVVFARLTEAPSKDRLEHPTGQDLPHCTFQVTDVIKGDKWAPRDTEISTLFFGEADKEATYLLMGTDPPEILWGSPMVVSDRAMEYIERVVELPEDGSRMNFFMDFLEDEDEMLARDAYDEFARASYETVQGLKDRMDRQQLLDWIRDVDVPIGRRKLYMTMVGVCGTSEDAAVLKEMIQSPERAQTGGLDALVAAYLMLEGEAGLEMIDQELLANDESEYADTYAAIMALRFHGNEVEKIPRQRLIQSMHLILDRTDLADLVIPDLARWEDWSAAPKLMELFKNADEEAAWVRVPVINYLKASSLSDKDQKIAELEQIDPEAVKRANAFFAFSGLASQGAQRGTDDEEEDGESAGPTSTGNFDPTSVDSSALAERGARPDNPLDTSSTDTAPVVSSVGEDEGFSVTLPTATAVGHRRESFLTGGVLIGLVVLVLVATLVSTLVLRGQRR